MHQKNDVSILLDSHLCLWEHQSSYNPNMPIRGLMYYARNMETILNDRQRRLLFGKSIVKIPAPEYYVMYNGVDELREREDLKLSDAFIFPSDGYEWTAHLININAGHNTDIMDRCPSLKGYAFLIQTIRDYRQSGMIPEEAVRHAIDDTIRSGYLVDYLSKARNEAYAMLLTEFDEKGYEQTIREESYEEGRTEGIEQGIEQGIAILIDNLLEENVPTERIKMKLVRDYGKTAAEASNIVTAHLKINR